MYLPRKNTQSSCQVLLSKFCCQSCLQDCYVQYWKIDCITNAFASWTFHFSSFHISSFHINFDTRVFWLKPFCIRPRFSIMSPFAKTFVESWRDPDFGVVYERTWFCTRWSRVWCESDVRKYYIARRTWKILKRLKERCWGRSKSLKYIRRFASKPFSKKVKQHSKLHKK